MKAVLYCIYLHQSKRFTDFIVKLLKTKNVVSTVFALNLKNCYPTIIKWKWISMEAEICCF